MIETIRQRLRDWRHERYIKALSREIHKLTVDRLERGGSRDHYRRFRRVWDDYCTAVSSRSHAQVARMERKKGLL